MDEWINDWNNRSSTRTKLLTLKKMAYGLKNDLISKCK